MERNNYFQRDTDEYSSKVRSKNSKRFRNNPYKNPKKSSPSHRHDNVDETNQTKGLISRVSEYIVPSWLSGWWSKEESEEILPDDYSSDDESCDDNVPSNSREQVNNKATEINHNSVPDLIASSRSAHQNLGPDLFKNVVMTSGKKKMDKPNIFESASNNQPTSSKTASPPLFTNQINTKATEKSALKSPKKSLNSSSSNLDKRIISRKRQSLSKPSFKVSAFLPADRTYQAPLHTSLSTSSFDFSSANKSLFYSGQTIYGGSSSIRDENHGKRKKFSPVSSRFRTTRTQIKAKPLKVAKQKTVASDTAKRILNTLDKISLPQQDQRKIQTFKNYKPSLSAQLRKSKTVFSQTIPKKPQPPISNESKNVSFVNDQSFFAHSKLERNENLSDSNMLCEMPSFLNKPNIVKPSKSEETLKTSLKIKREKSSMHYSGPQVIDNVNTLPEISKNTVSLPLNSLPKFDFTNTIKPPFTTLPAFTPISKTNSNVTKKIDDPKSNLFSFTKPSVKAEKSIANTDVIKTFSFCSPVPVTNNVNNVGIKSSEKRENADKKPQNDKKLFDFSKSTTDNKLNLASNTNKSSLKQVDANKENKVTTTVFKKLSKAIGQPPVNSWSCSVCMIDNKDSDSNCAACNAKKPVSKIESAVAIPTENKLSNKSNATNDKKLFVLKKFSKPIGQAPSDSWSCPVCMINNKNSDLNCVACNEKKPTQILSSSETKDTSKDIGGNKLKLKFKNQNNDTWECPTCMIENKNDILKCVACTEAKPGSELKSSVNVTQDNTSFSFGVPQSTGGFVFGAPVSKDISSSNTFKQVDTLGFKFGRSQEQNTKEEPKFSFGTPATFSFGANKQSSVVSDSENLSLTKESKPTFTFGASTTNTTKAGFTFGVPLAASKSNETETNNTAGFSFVPSTNNKNENKVINTGGFSFGLPNKKENKEATNASFSFGVTSKNENKEQNSAGFSFGLPSVTNENKKEGSTSSANFVVPPFTANKNESKETSNAGFSFGIPSATNKNESTVGFSFGLQKPASDVPGFTFGKSTFNKEANSSVPSVNFVNPSNTSMFAVPKKKEDKANEPIIAKDVPYKTIEEAVASGFLKVPTGDQNNTSNDIKFDKNPSAVVDDSLKNSLFQTNNSANFNFGNSNNSSPFNIKSDKSASSQNLFTTALDSNKKVGFNFMDNKNNIFAASGEKTQVEPNEKPLFQFNRNVDTDNKIGNSDFSFTSVPSTQNIFPASKLSADATATFNFGSGNQLFSNTNEKKSTGFDFTGSSNQPSFLSGSTPSFLAAPKTASNQPPQPSFLAESKAPQFQFTPSSLTNGQPQNNNPFNPIGGNSFLPSSQQSNARNIAARRKLKAARKKAK